MFISAGLGEILLNLDSRYFAESENWLQKAIDANVRNGMNFRLGLDYAFYGEYYRRIEDRAQAKNKIGKAIEILQECGADWWAEKYQKELAEL